MYRKYRSDCNLVGKNIKCIIGRVQICIVELFIDKDGNGSIKNIKQNDVNYWSDKEKYYNKLYLEFDKKFYHISHTLEKNKFSGCILVDIVFDEDVNIDFIDEFKRFIDVGKVHHFGWFDLISFNFCHFEYDNEDRFGLIISKRFLRKVLKNINVSHLGGDEVINRYVWLEREIENCSRNEENLFGSLINEFDFRNNPGDIKNRLDGKCTKKLRNKIYQYFCSGRMWGYFV